MYKMDLALNNLQWLVCHKTKPNQKYVSLHIPTHIHLSIYLAPCSLLSIFDFVQQIFLICLFCLWFVQIYVWVIWFLNGLNSGRCRMFLMYFRPLLKPFWGEQIMKWKIQWRVINSNLKSKPLSGNLKRS